MPLEVHIRTRKRGGHAVSDDAISVALGESVYATLYSEAEWTALKEQHVVGQYVATCCRLPMVPRPAWADCASLPTRVDTAVPLPSLSGTRERRLRYSTLFRISAQGCPSKHLVGVPSDVGWRMCTFALDLARLRSRYSDRIKRSPSTCVVSAVTWKADGSVTGS